LKRRDKKLFSHVKTTPGFEGERYVIYLIWLCETDLYMYIGKKEKLNCTKIPICFVLFQEICSASMIRYEGIYKLSSKGLRELSLISKNKNDFRKMEKSNLFNSVNILKAWMKILKYLFRVHFQKKYVLLSSLKLLVCAQFKFFMCNHCFHSWQLCALLF
jgi:hypothetical protein